MGLVDGTACDRIPVGRGARLQPHRVFVVLRRRRREDLKWKDGAVTVFREKSNGANGLTFDHQGRLLACEQDRVTRTEKDGSITVLAGGLRERPIDLIYAIDGSVYFYSASGIYRGKEIASRECERAVG